MTEISRLVSGNSIERVLDRIEASASHALIFAGVLDNNAKLLSFRKGKGRFTLPIERHDTLDVQLSLMFSLIRQLEDISGDHKFTATRFAKHDIFLFGTPDFHIFAITVPTAEGQIAKSMAEIAVSITDSNPQVTAPAVNGGMKDYSAGVTMTSTIHHAEPDIEPEKCSTSRPEMISILQGYFMALESGISIQNDEQSGYYRIRANEGDQFSWSTLEKVSFTFKDKIILHNIGKDVDDRVFLRISLK